MIDIHCHILPGLDDGAKELETSVAMCKMAADDGIEAIVCTPHSNDEYPFDPDVVQEKILELNAQTGGVPRLHRGCDFHLSYENIQGALAYHRRYTINGGMYLLVEFGDYSVPPNMAEVFFEFQSRSIIPIITHPERNAWLMSRREDLVKWLEAGALLQVTAGSLLGRFGKDSGRFCGWLLDRQMVHFVATDSHNVKSRPPLLSAAYKQVAASHGAETAKALFHDNPRSVIDNRYFDVPRPTDRPPRGLLSRITAAFRSR